MTSEIFDDDPILGAFVAHYPSNRARLLLIAGGALLLLWFVVTVALWQVEPGLAATITIIVLAVATLGLGWFVAHYWNREVVLYERGFAYREGSEFVPILYRDVHTIRQQGEQRTYFGGLLRRSTLQFTLLTDQDEIITLNNVYRKLDDLTLRLEKAITAIQRTKATETLANGGTLAFGADLTLSLQTIHAGGQDLPLAQYAGFRVQDGQLILAAQDDPDWYAIPLREVANLRLLVHFLREKEATA